MVSALLSRCLILVLGTLFPAYRSYKAVKNKDYKEYVKWMMYWIVFALFTAVETILDIFMSWFPFYYEIKILFILWVLSPATRGSSLLYKKVVHPLLCSREKEIDEFIEKTKQQGYTTFLNVFSSGFQAASTLFVNSALKGQIILENQLKKSLSMNDVNINNNNKNNDQTDNGVVVMKKRAQMIVEEDNDWVLDEFDNDNDLRNRINEDNEYLVNQSNKTESSKPAIIDDEQSSEVRKRHGRKAAAIANAAITTSSSETSTSSSKLLNYKSSEASHFGTISRAKKVSKTKAKQTTILNDSDT